MAWQELDVEVHLQPGQTPDFYLHCPALGLSQNNSYASFNNNGKDGFLLNFILQNPGDYRFPHEKNEALWCHAKPQCPTTACSWEGFEVKRVRPGNKVLEVRNKNVKPWTGEFSYALRITKQLDEHDPNREFWRLDPGGFNNNGSTRRTSSAAMLAVGAVCGSLLTLGAQSLMS
jgi:hypothetical protein